MSVEHPDVQWTVVCDGSAQAAFAAATSRAEAQGWTMQLEVKDTAGDSIPMGAVWPSETLGSGHYIAANHQGRRTVFWSTYSDGLRSKITGGLYLHEFVGDSTDALAACERAIAQLHQLFDGPEVSCLVLALEDDEEIDVSPGVVGIYRTAVWREICAGVGGGVVEQENGEWVIVRPNFQGRALVSVYSLPEPVQDSLHAIQTSLERMFWRASE